MWPKRRDQYQSDNHKIIKLNPLYSLSIMINIFHDNVVLLSFSLLDVLKASSFSKVLIFLHVAILKLSGPAPEKRPMICG